MIFMFICAEVMSSSLLVSKMNQASEDKNLKAYIFACPEAEIFSNLEGVDVILLAPQVRFLRKKIDKKLEGSIPILTIDMRMYGMMKGKEILESALDALK